MLDCAISPVYVGAATQNEPPDTPSKKRPTKSMVKLVANVTIAQPSVNGITSSNIVNFRPTTWIIEPMTRHTSAAPNVTNEPTHEKSSSVMGKSYSGSVALTIKLCVGDDHPNVVPAARAPPVAVIQTKKKKQTKINNNTIH